MKRWLWPLNVVISVLLAVLLVPAPLVGNHLSQSACSEEMVCDPHGYVQIMAGVAGLVLAGFAITAIGLTVDRRKGGLVMGVIHAVLLLWISLSLIEEGPLWLVIPVALLTLGSLGFCIAGLIAAPPRSKRREAQLDNVPWPQHPDH